MQELVNQFSFPITALVTVAVLTLLLLRDGVRQSDLLAIGALLIGFGLAFFLLQPGPGVFPDSDIVFDQIGAGTPVLLEFLSPY